MSIKTIDAKLNALVNKYQTRDPFELANKLNIKIFYEDLGKIYGYFNKDARIKMIHLNSGLNENDLEFTCAHELGHSIFHSNSSTPFLTKKSLTSQLKIEMEANYFATNLRIDGTHKEFEINSKYQILDYYNLPYEIESLINHI